MKFTPSKKCSLDQLGAIQLIILCSCFLVWYFVTSSRQKIISLLFSGIYSIIEYNFYRHTNDRPDGSFEIKWFGKPGMSGSNSHFLVILIRIYNSRAIFNESSLHASSYRWLSMVKIVFWSFLFFLKVGQFSFTQNSSLPV